MITLLLWLSCCAKVETMPCGDQTEIVVNAINSPLTKADYEGEPFGVISYISKTAPGVNWTDYASAIRYFQCRFIDNGEVWEAETSKYWPSDESHSLVFAGYSPYEKGETEVSAEYNIISKTLTFEDYQVEECSGTQTDLMYFLPGTVALGTALVGLNYRGEDTPVDVLFHHALSQLVCTVSIAEGDEDLVEAGSIVLKDLVSKGTCVISSGNSVAWTRSSADEDKDDETIVSGTPALLIPGTSYQIDVSYILKLPGGKELTETTTLDIDPTIYYAGYKYIYNITIGASAITVDTEYKEWTDE